jgi:dephospho-CoA kinase
MLTVGLTGSTGSGKGYVSEIMKKVGVACLDTDQVCRDVYRKGEPCYLDLLSFFGNEILREDGEIDRRALFHIAFPDKDKYEKLNSIAFYHIMKVTKRWLDEQDAAGERIAVIDAPMLFESGFDKLCQKVVCVIADRETQIRRVMKRDGTTEEVAIGRLAKQKDNDYYRSRADYVLDNSASNEENIHADTHRLIEELQRISAQS